MTDYEIEMELEAALEALPKENPPVNLSDWNSGSDYKEKLASVVKLGKKSDLFDYQYFFPDCIKNTLPINWDFLMKLTKILFLRQYLKAPFLS